MISRGVEISIAGRGGEMVRGLSIGRFLPFFFFFFNNVLIVLMYKKLHGALAIAKTKPINNPIARFTYSWEKSNSPSP